MQDDKTRKYAIIKLNPDLTLNYTKYYTTSGGSNIGLTNLWFSPSNNNELFTGGWYKSNNIDTNLHGIIAKVNKNTGKLDILKILNNVGRIFIAADNINLYGVTEGDILKIDLNSLNLVAAKQINNYEFNNIVQNNNYIATYRYNNNPVGVAIVKKDLSESI